MKKFFTIILSIIYLLTANATLAMASELYFVKNSDKELIKPIIDSIFTNEKYNIIKRDPYYAISQKNSNDYVLIILQKSSSNYFYYHLSTKNTKINKSVLNALKERNIIFEQSYNANYISIFEKQAQKILTNTESNYSFTEPEKINPQSVVQNQTTAENALKGGILKIAKGAKFNAYLETPLNTATASIGDEVRAILTADWVYNGIVVAPQGSVLTGTLSKARHANYGSCNGRVVFSFDQLTTPEGKTFGITTDKIDFTVTNDGKIAKAVSSVLVGAAVGALAGLLIGALSRDANAAKSALIGAGIGAGGSAISSAAERGVDAEIPVYTELEIILDKPLSVVFSY